MRYTKDDVTRSYHQGSQGLPMVNVKVHGMIEDAWKDAAGEIEDERFTPEWQEEHVSEDDLSDIFWFVCSHEFEQIQQDAEEIFGKVDVYQEGRSGGWAVVSGLADVDEWDAIALGKWRRFEKYARAIVADIPFQMLMSVYLNDFEAWASEQLETEPIDAAEALAAR